MRCPACSTESAADAKFCEDCGAALSPACPNCGAAVTAGKRFCRECGASVDATAAPTAAEPAGPVAERRVVSVLFVDLVGFTPISESRDPEQVRELLSRYFDTARTIVDRYGGVVEKFIGDAVMAVWGVPSAHGDDSERAVRAALDLTDSVAALGVEVGATGLAARAGVVTGEVAVTLGAVGEGMVAGDAVNTAARVQSEASAGSVLVDDVTRQATAVAIGYEDTGPHALKGKTDAVRLWRATHVVGGVGGSDRVDGLEARLLGRDSEMRALKEAFHACVDAHRARLVSVVGAAGIGKSRLRWEFFKYVDGLAATAIWHTGRCLPYGDGVAYWALAEIVRARLDIAEEEPGEQVAQKLDAGLTRWIASEADREFLLPRLGALLGIAEPGLAREDLFAGWRLWFERLAEHDPVVLVIEDLQWADAGLLDFVEHLLDWSADHPIFLLTLSRPELPERRPTWAAGRRNATTLVLDPLPDTAMTELLGELVPGLPSAVAERMITRADGVPLYAVDLVRALIDRDLVQPVAGTYRLVGEVEDFDVPASLTSLVAARIDALDPEERALVQALAVLGGTFPRAAVGAITQLPSTRVDELLATLVRKEILGVRTDRLSPDRGQYAFTQSLLRSVAYDTLSRRDRKARHLAVAAHLRATFPDDGAEVAEVVAQHYRDAYEAVRDDPDADEIRDLATAAFARAGQRATSVGAPEAAERAYATAAELSGDEAQHAELLTRAGEAAMQAGRYDAAAAHAEAAISSHRAAGRDLAAADAVALLGWAMAASGRPEQAIPLVEPVLNAMSADAPTDTAARLHCRLGHLLVFTGRRDQAMPHVEAALELAQALELPAVLAEAAVLKGLLFAVAGRHEEALATSEWAARYAEQRGLGHEAHMAYGNAADMAMNADQSIAVQHFDACLDFARRRGDPAGEGFAVYNRAVIDLFAGRWSEVEVALADLRTRFDGVGAVRLFVALAGAQLHARRGQIEQSRSDIEACVELAESEDVQDQAMYKMTRGIVSSAEGDKAAAVRWGGESTQLIIDTFGVRHECVRQAWPEAVDAALSLGDIETSQRLLDLVADRPIGHIPPYLRAQLARFRARIAAAQGRHESVEQDMRLAERMLAELGYPYHLAQARLDYARWLIETGRPADATSLLRQAEETLEALGAVPALSRCRELLAAAPVDVAI